MHTDPTGRPHHRYPVADRSPRMDGEVLKKLKLSSSERRLAQQSEVAQLTYFEVCACTCMWRMLEGRSEGGREGEVQARVTCVVRRIGAIVSIEPR